MEKIYDEMMSKDQASVWEEQYRLEYNTIGDNIFVAHAVCRWFQRNDRNCRPKWIDQTYGKLSNTEVQKEYAKEILNIVSRWASHEL